MLFFARPQAPSIIQHFTLYETISQRLLWKNLWQSFLKFWQKCHFFGQNEDIWKIFFELKNVPTYLPFDVQILSWVYPWIWTTTQHIPTTSQCIQTTTQHQYHYVIDTHLLEQVSKKCIQQSVELKCLCTCN